jgi:uncharacterized RDD family membrane protein YckC
MTEATVFCTQCGQAVNAAASFCTRCGGTLTPSVPGMTIAAPGGAQYGGFWIRFVARLIDGAVVSIVLGPIAVILMSGYFATHHALDRGQPPDAGFFVMIGLMAMFAGVSSWLYEALMTSSSKQGTLGKMVFRMKVTDLHGARISFARATGRFLAKILSGMILNIGYIMAGFTERKQALHDMIVGTLVLRG